MKTPNFFLFLVAIMVTVCANAQLSVSQEFRSAYTAERYFHEVTGQDIDLIADGKFQGSTGSKDQWIAWKAQNTKAFKGVSVDSATVFVKEVWAASGLVFENYFMTRDSICDVRALDMEKMVPNDPRFKGKFVALYAFVGNDETPQTLRLFVSPIMEVTAQQAKTKKTQVNTNAGAVAKNATPKSAGSTKQASTASNSGTTGNGKQGSAPSGLNLAPGSEITLDDGRRYIVGADGKLHPIADGAQAQVQPQVQPVPQAPQVQTDPNAKVLPNGDVIGDGYAIFGGVTYLKDSTGRYYPAQQPTAPQTAPAQQTVQQPQQGGPVTANVPSAIIMPPGAQALVQGGDWQVMGGQQGQAGATASNEDPLLSKKLGPNEIVYDRQGNIVHDAISLDAKRIRRYYDSEQNPTSASDIDASRRHGLFNGGFTLFGGGGTCVGGGGCVTTVNNCGGSGYPNCYPGYTNACVSGVVSFRR